MKKWCAIVLAGIMLFSFCTGVNASSIVIPPGAKPVGGYYSSTLLPIVGFSSIAPATWYNDPYYRAYFSVIAIIELAQQKALTSPDAHLGSSNSYLGYNGQQVFLMLKDGNAWVCISSDGRTSFSLNPISCTLETQVPEFMSSVGATVYHKNDNTQMLTIFAQLLSN